MISNFSNIINTRHLISMVIVNASITFGELITRLYRKLTGSRLSYSSVAHHYNFIFTIIFFYKIFEICCLIWISLSVVVDPILKIISLGIGLFSVIGLACLNLNFIFNWNGKKYIFLSVWSYIRIPGSHLSILLI